MRDKYIVAHLNHFKRNEKEIDTSSASMVRTGRERENGREKAKVSKLVCRKLLMVFDRREIISGMKRDGSGREEGEDSGWGTHVYLWQIHVDVWQKPMQYCKVINCQLK